MELEKFLEGFEKGYNQIPIGKKEKARQELCKVIGIKKTSLYKHIEGRSNPRLKQVIGVRDYFMTKYGLKLNQIFGKEDADENL
jgi:DNA-binding XRE family transcriptional regulator